MTSEELNLSNFKSCAENASDGTYEHVKQLNNLIGESVDNLMRDLRAVGLKANNCGLAFRLEAAIYDYVRRSNSDSPLFPTAEGFGESMSGPARDRVLLQTASNLEFLKSVGVA